MAASDVLICNSALAKVGANRIVSLADNTPEAKICSEQYAKVRDELLRSHPWNFSIKRVSIDPDVSAPAFGYKNQFTLPSDFLRALSITEYEDTTEWRKEGGKILSDVAVLKLLYIARVTDSTLFDSIFDEVLALKLAHDISYAITQSTSLRDSLFESYKRSLADARTFDAQESSVRQVQSLDFFNARF